MLRLPALLLAALIVLVGCGDDPANDPDVEALAGAEGIEEGAMPAPAAPAPGATGAACLIGTWAADAEYSFRPEMWAGIAPGAEDFAMAYAGHEGRALVTFAADGSTRQRFENFALSIDGETPVGEMSTIVSFDGTAEGRYTVDGDRLRFEPGEANLTSRSRASVGGREVVNSAVDMESLFESGERSLTTFTCSGDELLLDIHESAEGGRVLFDDARYTRVDG